MRTRKTELSEGFLELLYLFSSIFISRAGVETQGLLKTNWTKSSMHEKVVP